MKLATFLPLLLHQTIALPQLVERSDHNANTARVSPQNIENLSASTSNAESILYELPAGFKVEPDLDARKPVTPGARMVKIRNGPYIVGPNRMFTLFAVLPMPCKDCFVTALMGDLEYENGTNANIESGAWLHHMTMSNSGKMDLVCGRGWGAQRMYSAGNEREVSRINAGGLKYGLQVGKRDQYSMLFELMNQNAQNIRVYVTQTYEIVEGAAASGYKDAKMIWMDITGCGGSEVSPLEGAYEAISPIWKSTVNGTLLFSTGHTHDGGVDTTLYLNGKAVCVNGQLYGRKKPYVERETGRTHISDIGVCTNFGQIKVGDELRIGAHYNTTLYPLEKAMDGHGLEPVMGISRIYIGT